MWSCWRERSRSPLQLDPNRFTSLGPQSVSAFGRNWSGRVNSIAFDPTNAHVAYLAVNGGGIWKTINKGTFWTPIFEGVPDNTFGDLAICDADSRVIWAGTGEQNRDRFAKGSARKVGLNSP